MNGRVRVAVVALAWTLPLCISRAAEPEVELAGIHIGQPLDQVRHALSGKASFEKEDEGQQVWRVLTDPAMQYVILGFDRERRVRYITALAAPGGAPLTCAPLGDAPNPVKSGKAGNNEWWREIKQPGMELRVIARGASPDRLSSCSIRKQGAGLEQEEEEEERTPAKHK